MKELDLTSLPRPVGHRVLIKPDAVEEVSKGGIIIHTSNKDRVADAQIGGVLIAVGPTAWRAFDDGVPWAKVGDRVLFAMHGGYSIKVQGEVYRVMNDEDVTAVIDEDAADE